MSEIEPVENRTAEIGLLIFFYTDAEGSEYDDFREFYSGIVNMVAHKNFGWTTGITDEGYLEVQKAYTALKELSFFDEYGEDDLPTFVVLPE